MIVNICVICQCECVLSYVSVHMGGGECARVSVC